MRYNCAVARVHPFRALRPTPEAAARVASVPYDVVSRSEAAELAASNRLNFLHVSRAEIEFPTDVDPYSDDVYRAAADNFRKLRRQAPLVIEEDPSVYFYRLSKDGQSQTGLAACFSLDEYEHGAIKKHERTRRDKEDDRTRHMIALRAQTGPVFLTYRALPDIDRIADRVSATAPLIDFTAVDAVRHTIWRVGTEECARIVQTFGKVPALYIADGHHRAASAARARRELRSAALAAAAELARHAGVNEYDTFLGVAFPHDQVRILPYNRVVQDLAGRSPEAFVAEVRRVATVREGRLEPSRKGEVSMYLDGRWYAIELTTTEPGPDDDRVASLDVTILQDRIIGPILNVNDVRTDKRIDFVGGLRGSGELERLVDRGASAVAFSMFPVTVADLIAIADAGGIMPPKSTWFEPKLRDGLLSHLI